MLAAFSLCAYGLSCVVLGSGNLANFSSTSTISGYFESADVYSTCGRE